MCKSPPLMAQVFSIDSVNMGGYIQTKYTWKLRSHEMDNRSLEVNNDEALLLQQCQSMARVRHYGPSLSVDPTYEPSPAPSMLGAFVVGSTPYLPYIFWSKET